MGAQRLACLGLCPAEEVQTEGRLNNHTRVVLSICAFSTVLACGITRVGIVWDVKVTSEPGALLAVLSHAAYYFKHIGLKTGRCRNGNIGLSRQWEPTLVCAEA